MLDRYRYLEKLAKYSESDSYSGEFRDDRVAVTSFSGSRIETGSVEEIVLLVLGATSGLGAIALLIYPFIF